MSKFSFYFPIVWGGEREFVDILKLLPCNTTGSHKIKFLNDGDNDDTQHTIFKVHSNVKEKHFKFYKIGETREIGSFNLH